MPIEIFNFQYIRADQNLFGLIPAGRTAFLSLQKAIDLFAKIAKLTIPMIKKSATKFLCSSFFLSLLLLTRRPTAMCLFCHVPDAPVYRLLT
jgi:hypothetical protein